MITFEPYKEKDKDSCLNIFNSNLPKFFASDEFLLFKSYLERENKTYWCMKKDGDIIGCGGIHMEPDHSVEDNELNCPGVSWGMIHSDFHKQGYGRQLLLFRLKQLALNPDVKKIKLDTTQYNPGFFSRFGFIEISVSKNYYGPGLDSHVMLLELTPEYRQLLYSVDN